MKTETFNEMSNFNDLNKTVCSQNGITSFLSINYAFMPEPATPLLKVRKFLCIVGVAKMW